MTPLSKLRKINALIVSLVCVFIFASCVNEDNQLGLDLVKTSGGMDILQAPDGIQPHWDGRFLQDNLLQGSLLQPIPDNRHTKRKPLYR